MTKKSRLSYFEVITSVFLLNAYKCREIKSFFGLKEQQSSHFFLFRKFISTKKPSVGLDSIETGFDGISSPIYKIIPPPLWFQSRRKGAPKPFIINWLAGKLLSSFVSKITKISIYLVAYYITKSTNSRPCLSIISLIWEIKNSTYFLKNLYFNELL